MRERLGDAPAWAPVKEDLPAPGLFAGVVSQEAAVAALRAAAANPVHAYLFRGAPGNGGLAAAYGFAAALLCPDGGCGVCATCRAALAGTDPDLHVVRRSGASVSIGDLRQVVSLAQRRPLHAARQVIVVLDVHLAALRAPALLKTLEEPPGDTVFILLADDVVPELVTVASRCVEVAFPPVPRAELVQWLTESGVPADMAAVVADSAGGNPERARIMVDDPDVVARVALWTSVPEELTSAGMTAAGLTRRVLDSADRAVEPLRAAHAREIEALTAAAKEMGERGLPGARRSSSSTSARNGASAPTRCGPASACWRGPTVDGWSGRPGAPSPWAIPMSGAPPGGRADHRDGGGPAPKPQRDPVGAVALRAPGRPGGVALRGGCGPGPHRASGARPPGRRLSLGLEVQPDLLRVARVGGHMCGRRDPARGGAAGRLEIRVLGPVEIAWDGRPVDIGGVKARALVARLLIDRQIIVSVDRLVDSLWGDNDGPGGQRSRCARPFRVCASGCGMPARRPT